MIPALEAQDSQLKPFKTGLVSTCHYERDGCFSRDMKQFCFTRMYYGQQVILVITLDSSGRWGEPEVASFSGRYSDSSPFITPDEKKLYFCSARPVDPNKEEPKDYDIYFVEKKQNGTWGNPIRLGPEVNTELNEYHPSVAANGNLYFCAQDREDKSKIHIYMAKWENNSYSKAVKLGNAINSKSGEVNPFISPDEKYLLYTSYRSGGGDIYINHRKQSHWDDSIKLNEPINSVGRDYCPYITPDGKYLIFSSNRIFYKDHWKKPKTYEEILRMFRGPGNGMMDIYRVEAGDPLKK
jgi:Tol biopolymer transport system component